ncbi:cupin domain-containing protein [Rhodobacterales bacterium]|nr:cupin domain-containing protein [Rhodobacterales bacterium]
MPSVRLTATLFLALLFAGSPVLAADKSITPEGKPAPSQPHAKPGSKAAQEAEEAAKTPYANAKDILSSSETVAGEKIAFPRENPSVKAEVVLLEPGEKTAWHQHHTPIFAYVLEGEVTVIYEEVGKKVYREGDAFLEAMRVTHRGENTGEGPARILSVFMLGDDNKPTVLEDAPGANKDRVE